MKERFKDKVVLCTGAAQGIGLATAQEFAKAGAKVILSDVLDMTEQVKELTDAGCSAYEYKCDVSSPEQVENMINRIVEKFGRLDCGFNNAGVQTPQRPMAEITINAVLPGVILTPMAKDIIKRNPAMEEAMVRDIPKGRLESLMKLHTL